MAVRIAMLCLMIDQDRMILLQQLVTAKLNCTAFICNAATNNNILMADNAYAGSNMADIIKYAGILDNYNNSGDSQTVPAGLLSIGLATPKISLGWANISFWDNP